MPLNKPTASHSCSPISQSCFFLILQSFRDRQTSIHGQMLHLNSNALSIRLTITFLHILTAATFQIHVSICYCSRQDKSSSCLSFGVEHSSFFQPIDVDALMKAIITMIAINVAAVIIYCVLRCNSVQSVPLASFLLGYLSLFNFSLTPTNSMFPFLFLSQKQSFLDPPLPSFFQFNFTFHIQSRFPIP